LPVLKQEKKEKHIDSLLTGYELAAAGWHFPLPAFVRQCRRNEKRRIPVPRQALIKFAE